MATTHATTQPDQAQGNPFADIGATLDQVECALTASLVQRHLLEVEERLVKAPLAARSTNERAAIATLRRLSASLKAESSILAAAEGHRE